MILAIIDDDEINHFIIKRMINKISDKIIIHSFYEVEKGLDFIHTNETQLANLPQIIFLDINMPGLDGWYFIEHLEKMQYKLYNPDIYMVSSSVHQKDLDKAKSSGYIKKYLTKPISQQTLNDILEKG